MRTLVAHLLMMQRGLVATLTRPSSEPPLTLAQYVRRYRPDQDDITRLTERVAGTQTPAMLLEALRESGDPRLFLDGADASAVVSGGRGPLRVLDLLRTRLLEIVVHTDDLSRSLPEREAAPLHRAALAAVTRLLAEVLAEQAPGRSVEVRVAPFVAVQAIPGPRHTRGTPPNVVEMTPLIWMRLATGRIEWATTESNGDVRASGSRSSLADYLPLM